MNARLATATERGRELYLEGFLEESLGVFKAASSLRPEDQRIRDWVLKVRRDLSTELMLKAREMGQRRERLRRRRGAAPRGRRALGRESRRADQPRRRCATLAEWDRNRAQYYYDQGNRDLDANEIRVAQWSFERTREYDDQHPGAERRINQLQKSVLDLEMRRPQRADRIEALARGGACLARPPRGVSGLPARRGAPRGDGGRGGGGRTFSKKRVACARVSSSRSLAARSNAANLLTKEQDGRVRDRGAQAPQLRDEREVSRRVASSSSTGATRTPSAASSRSSSASNPTPSSSIRRVWRVSRVRNATCSRRRTIRRTCIASRRSGSPTRVPIAL